MGGKKAARKKRGKKAVNKNKTNPSQNSNLNQKISERKQTAEDFIKNLGPDGYIKASETLNKDVHVDRYYMSTPDGLTPLLNNVSIDLNHRKRYGLVGKNGSGKSTLLKNIANYSIENFPTHIRMIHVQQEHKPDEYNVIDSVLKSDIIRTQLIDEETRLNDLLYTEENDEILEETQEQLDRITEYMEDLEIRESIQRASRILMGLGFTKEMQKLPTKSLSGGWRMRVELAKALFVSPDLLLLDEPTNHLDFPAVLWLQEYLITEFHHTLVIVSHDRTFLNSVITHVIFLNDVSKTLEYFKGDYNQFEKQKKEDFQASLNLFKSYQVQISSLKDFIEKFRDKGEKRAAQVQSKMKTLKKLEEENVEMPKEVKAFEFKFPEPDYIEQHIVQVEDVSFGYNSDKIILRNINLTIDMDSRIGVIGANGVGKSTLIKLIMGLLNPISGYVNRNRQARIAYFTQHHYDQLDLNTSAVEYFLEKFKVDLEETPDRTQFVRRHLGRFGIKGDRQNQKMGLLSGGQKSRVAFAVLTFKTPHFIIMDEPTNHLDLETVDALISALSDFKGGLLIISHDQHFLNEIGQVFWSVTPEKIRRFRNFSNAKNFALQKRIDEVHYF